MVSAGMERIRMDKYENINAEYDLERFAEYNFRKPQRLVEYADAIGANSNAEPGLPVDGLPIKVSQVAAVVALNQLVDGKANAGAYAELLAAFDPADADEPREYDLVDNYAAVSVNAPGQRAQVFGQYLRAQGVAISDAQVAAALLAFGKVQREINAPVVEKAAA